LQGELLADVGFSSSLRLASKDPPMFRTVLLVAASHYTLQAGGLHHYEETYRFHMAKTINDIQELLDGLGNSIHSMTRCAKLISTLCMVEVSCFLVPCISHLSPINPANKLRSPANTVLPRVALGTTQLPSITLAV
jgi:hypothetical protein